ncbi:multidrug effflux MFS transporter [Mesobacterium pallidum]|uniref:multidrug effflux MFS transporter n=1 Tax=Mesobacterium pallidum TaxID=2872037 RepID=UPI001EE1AB41|nr:multidrug effflux MFS transporter [Mesobacterium pallidum]
MLRTALILGLLSIVGPFAIDMYLPAMPAIAAEFAVDEQAVQLTLSAYFAAFGVAQLIYGPWADQSGRKLPVAVGLALFAVASVGAARAGSAEALVAWRVAQGLGGAALMAVPRAIVRDQYRGPEAAQLMAMLMLVIAVSPMLAPLAGSIVLAFADWRWIFGAMAVVATLGLAVLLLLQPETLPPEKRVKVNMRNLLAGCRILFRDPVFMGLTFIGGFAMASFFVFIASAPFVYTEAFGLTETQFSYAFAVNAAGFFGASQLAGWLGARWGMRRLVRRGVAGFAIATCTLLLAAVTMDLGLVPIIFGLVLANACLGVVVPTVMVVALDDHGENAGLASSLGGTLQMVTGGLVVALAGPFFDGTAVPMIGAIAACALAAGALTLLTLGARPMATA